MVRPIMSVGVSSAISFLQLHFGGKTSEVDVRCDGQAKDATNSKSICEWCGNTNHISQEDGYAMRVV